MIGPYLLGLAGPGRYVPDAGEGDPGIPEPPIITVIDEDVTIHGKVKAGSFGKFVYPLATIQAGRRYTFRVQADFSQMTKQGDLAMVGFGFKDGNQFHIAGLRGDGAAGTDEYIVHGTPPNGWNKQTGHTEVDEGAAAAGTQYDAYYRLTTSVDGTTYMLETDTDAASYSTVVSAQAPTPFTNVSGVETFGIALWFNNTDTGIFTITVTEFEDEAAPLGLLSPTGAWSFSRDLVLAFAGNARYTEDTGKIDALIDQTGNTFDLLQTTAARRPTAGTAGPNSITCGVFNSTDTTYLTTPAGDDLADLINADAGYIVVSFVATTIDANNATVYANEGVIADTGQFMGLFCKTGDALHVYNFDTTIDTTSTAITEGTVYVAEWRHDAGVVYLRINGSTEVSATSGNTGGLAGLFRIGSGSGTSAGSLDGSIFEVVAFDAVPTEAQRNAIVADMMEWVGAV